MQPEEFISRVANGGPNQDPGSARIATLATIESLCEHLPKEQSENLAAQLPDDLALAAQAGGELADTSNTPIKLSEFYEKVALKTQMAHDDATGFARAVTTTLKEAISSGELTNVVLDLPPDLPQLINGS